MNTLAHGQKPQGDDKRGAGESIRLRHQPAPSHNLAVDRFWSKVDKSGECWTWRGALSQKGYGRVSTHGRNRVAAHRFSYLVAFGEIPVGMVVCHKCDNPPCVRPDHLFAGTQLDNIRDCIKKGRRDESGRIQSILRAGENSVSAKLNWETVRAIRANVPKRGVLNYCREISKKHGMGFSSITDIVYGYTWKEISGGESPNTDAVRGA